MVFLICYSVAAFKLQGHVEVTFVPKTYKHKTFCKHSLIGSDPGEPRNSPLEFLAHFHIVLLSACTYVISNAL